VATRDPAPTPVVALTAHNIPRDKIFSEKISTRVRERPQFEEALRTAREIKAHAPHCRVILTVYEMKRLGRTPCSGAARTASRSSRSSPTGKRKGLTPNVASVYRALAEYEKKEAYPEAIEEAHTDFARLQNAEIPSARP
jgi:Resolvase, N terminal domain